MNKTLKFLEEQVNNRLKKSFDDDEKIIENIVRNYNTTHQLLRSKNMLEMAETLTKEKVRAYLNTKIQDKINKWVRDD